MPRLDLLQDFRFAARLLAKDRRFTSAAVVALALGIAANNTVFTFINTALWKPLPFDAPHQIVSLGSRDVRGRDMPVSYADFQDWRDATRTLSELAATAGRAMNFGDDGRAPERVRGAHVSANTFELLRIRPLRGRGFLPEDDRPDAPPVVLLGHQLWQRRYDADPSVVGRTVRVNDVPSVVVGVMPPRFSFPGTMEAWQPLALMPNLRSAPRDMRNLGVTARLRESATIDQARTELNGIAAQLAAAHPDTNRGIGTRVERPFESLRQQTKPLLMSMMIAVAFVLLIACANVANLLLARAAGRAREIAVRTSLGATRGRIIRQLLIESTLLASIAGVVGLLLSVYSVRYFGVAFDAIEVGAPDRSATPYWVDLTMDGRVFGFVAALCLGTSILFGLAPALHISKTNVNDALKDGGRTAGGSRRVRRWTDTLIVFEVALTLVLLTSAGLMLRNFVTVYRSNLVIDTTNVVTARIALPAHKYSTPDQLKAFIAGLDERVAADTRFQAATIASDIPLVSLGGSMRQLSIAGRPPTGDKPPTVSTVLVGPRYFETLGLRVMQGRSFTALDGSAGHETAIVNLRFAELFFPNADPLGQRIRLTAPGAPPAPAAPPLAIVAIVQTLPQRGPGAGADPPVVYVPLRGETAPIQLISLIVRGGSGLRDTLAALREDVAALEPHLPLYAIQTLDEAVARTRYPLRLMGSLFGCLAIIALVLASVGLFALTAHGVAQRIQEIGVRMALGAQASEVVWLFLRRTLSQLALGLVIGLPGALVVGQVILVRNFIGTTNGRDPITLAAVAALLIGVAVIACVVPARRAARVDPVVALRQE